MILQKARSSLALCVQYWPIPRPVDLQSNGAKAPEWVVRSATACARITTVCCS